MKEEEIRLVQTIIFLLEGVSEANLMLRYGLGDKIKKAKEIVKLINDK
ncbi:MAG: hypothetical protein ACOC1P_03145 [Minisyncoccales bacterium]